MGSGNSRPTFPSYPAARAKCDVIDFNRTIKNFEKVAGKDSITLEQFTSKFPPEGETYSRLLYYALRNGYIIYLNILYNINFLFI